MSLVSYIRNFFVVAGEEAVTRIAEWVKEKFYTKSEVYTKEEIDAMLSAGVTYLVVDSLPSTGVNGTIYLVPKQDAETGDVYDEYIWLPTRGLVSAHFEHIGSTDVDLSNYYTKTQADDLLDDKVDKVNGKGLSTEDYTTAEKNKLSSIENGAEVNVQSDWNQSDSTKDDFIKNKPTLRQPSTDGTAGQYLKSNGSGNAPSWETMDSSPTANSTKAVTSGGVKTALDGKQASISIATNANTPTDNDTVIMQDSGNTGTTSFLRRKLSTLWNYFRTKKFPEVNVEWGTSDVIRDVSALDFVSNYRQRGNALPSSAIVYERSTDGGTTWVDDSSHVGFVNQADRLRITIIGRESDGSMNVIYCQVAKHFINMRRGTCHYALYGINKEGEVYQITSGRVAGNTHPNSIYAKNAMLGYYKTQYQADAYIKHRFEFWQEEGDDTYAGAKYPLYVGLTPKVIWGGNNTLLYGVPYVITTDGTNYKENVKFPQNVEATKFVKTGGTSSQYLKANGDVATISTTPTSGSSNPITSGGVYTAMQDKQSILTITIPDNSGYRVMQLIADVTDSFNAPNYNIVGLTGYIYQWRYGATGTIPHRITAIGAHDASQVWLYTDCDLETRTLLPYLIKYNGRYYIALKKTSSSRSGIRLLGYWNGLLSEPINLYANSTASKWYSDSERTHEITFEIVKSYSRYPNAYLDFGGTASQVVLGTGELKTIDSSVASGSSNLVTSGAVYTAINGIDTSGKVNLQPDFTASQIDYSAGNVGKWQKVLRFPEGADLVINMKKTAMGSDSTSTLWFSSSSMGDSYTSLFGNHSVRFVRDGGYVFLVLACRKSTNEPIESYTFQIAHSSVPMSDIVAVTDASPITATPKEPNIVYRAPITTGAVSFNVTSGAGSVYMSGHNDFLGNMTSEATNGVTVTMSGATEGQIYRFVFTRNITGGVTFKQSNVAYCTISGDVNAGDTITLTAVSNTADGWLYEQESAGIESSDGSNIIEYNGSTADVRVNWDKLPADVVRNNSHTESDGRMAIAQYASAGQNAFAGGTYANAAETSVALGYNAKTVDNFCVAVGVNAKATGQGSTAVNGESKNSYGTAVGFHSLVDDAFGGVALGYYACALGSFATALGGYANAFGYAVSLGEYAKAGYSSGDSNYPRYLVKRYTAIDFEEGGETKKYKFVNYGDSATITLSGNSVILMPPNENCKFFVVVNSDASTERIYRSVTSYARINGIDAYVDNMESYDIKPVAVNGNSYWALWLQGNPSNFPSEVDSFSFLAYYKNTSDASYQIAIGNYAASINKCAIAIGASAKAVADGQIVIGAGNIPNESDKLIIGNGTTAVNNRKNILTIDTNERLKVCSYVGETQTIEMNQQTGSLSNITKAVYRIRWNDTGTVNLTLGTSGCVEGQRVTIFAETNDVQIRFTSYLIPEGRFCDFMFLGGAWRPSMGIEELVS